LQLWNYTQLSEAARNAWFPAFRCCSAVAKFRSPVSTRKEIPFPNSRQKICRYRSSVQIEPSSVFSAITVAGSQSASASLMNHFYGIEIHFKYNIM